MALVEVPDRRRQPSARIARTPPMPRTSSWWRRISRPRTYRMWVIGRSSTAFSGRRCRAAGPARDRPGRARRRPTGRDRAARRVTVSGSPFGVLDARQRQAAQVVVGVVVLLVAVGVDRLAEVALAIEQADADERQGHVAGGLHVVAGEDAEAARSRCRATRGCRTRRRSRRSGPSSLSPCLRWNQWPGAVGHVAIEVGQDVVVLGQELLVVEEAATTRSDR